MLMPLGLILLGLKKPVHILQLGSSVRSIVNMALIAVVDAQIKCKNTSTDEIVKKSPLVETIQKSKQGCITLMLLVKAILWSVKSFAF